MGQPFKEEHDLSKYHTYGIHAKARYLIEVTTAVELIEAITFALSKNIPYLFLGRGSNILFRDDYYPGLVIINKMNAVNITDTIVYVESGMSLPLLCRKTTKSNLSGLEPLVGIPGSVGGAIFMNAGVSGNEISKHLVSVTVLQRNGEIHLIKKEEGQFSYRKSIFQENGDLILSASFSLEKSVEGKKQLLVHLKNRVNSQPIEMKNAGCIFKNPDHELSAGRIIDRCGLKGLRYGGAEVSVKHANFINNLGNATFNDVFSLSNKVQEKVFTEMGVKLAFEVWVI